MVNQERQPDKYYAPHGDLQKYASWYSVCAAREITCFDWSKNWTRVQEDAESALTLSKADRVFVELYGNTVRITLVWLDGLPTTEAFGIIRGKLNALAS